MVAGISVAGGVALGSLDFLWIKYLPYPFAELGNSTATWAVAAFFLGRWVRSGPLRAALAASVLLVVAVPSYYLAATLVQGDDLAVLWAPSSVLWMAFGVVAGVVFGVGGTWSRRDGWRQVIGAALPAAVFVEEAARFAGRANDPGYPGAGWNVAIDLALALLLLVLVGRSNRQRALAAAVALPLAGVILVAFAVVGGSAASAIG
ncbi:DUF6518 family protein [Micromonospora sp. HK10]|uniref:DUF6518 family protein n=1 Tax=Micromonospora sp. HK10 TaxID=1538294 RepID=UPI000B28EA87|nr:DUF6518 family protein [Micromonospora sp. HK10]